MKLIVHPGGALAGRVAPPGDKSITHRAILVGLLAADPVKITAANTGADCVATLDCARALGASVEGERGTWTISARALVEPARVLDCGNSGTALRLLAGVLAGQPFFSVLTGDASLVARPIERVVTPLRRMGATLSGRDHDRLPPLAIRGAPLAAIRYRLPIASAQVASCLLLAGLGATGETEIEIPGPARDHTERMLRAAGVPIEENALPEGGRHVRVTGPARPRGGPIRIPGDFSAGAFSRAAAAAVPGAEVTGTGVGLNPSRTGLLDVLEAMGARIERDALREEMGEPVGDVRVTGPERLRAFDVPPAWVPRMIDEAPAWAIAASAAAGRSRLTGAAELRVKESDRIAALEQLRTLGVTMTTTAEGLVIRGTGGRRLRGARVESHGDHRIAMAFGVAGLVSEGGVEVVDAGSAEVSFPGFFARLAALGAPVEGA